LEGGFSCGAPNGYCRVIYANGNYYEGNFINGKLTGQGIFEGANGGTYVGEWKDFNKHGKGTERTTEGIYAGDFINNKRNGQGKLTYNDGTIYSGLFVEGVAEGIGSYIGIPPVKYTGMWSNGKKQGKGELILEDHNVYEGEFVNDLMHGHGVLVM